MDIQITEGEMPTYTYRLDREKKRIKGFVDGKEAMEQAIFKILQTERYQYPVYSFQYGSEILSLIGQDEDYVEMELKRRITEALLTDDRIYSVEEFEWVKEGDSLKMLFRVATKYSAIQGERAVY